MTNITTIRRAIHQIRRAKRRWCHTVGVVEVNDWLLQGNAAVVNGRELQTL